MTSKNNGPIDQEKARKFIEQRNQYFNNAKESISKKEFRKASELLWGAITQTLKALAALRGIEIAKHSEFFSLMERLAKERDDPAIYYNFVDLNALHRNFYDDFIPDGAFPDFFNKARRYIGNIEDIIHDVLREERKREAGKKS